MELGAQTPAQVSESLCIPPEEAEATLESMAKRNLLFRLRDGDTVTYNLIPVIHGFLEFNLDRLDYDIARNFSKHYVNGMGARFFGSSEPLFRVLPVRPDIVENDLCLEIDDYEAILRRQDKIGITACFCRMSSNMNPKATGCTHNPNYSEQCIVLGVFADFYVENGNGRYISFDDAMAHMQKCDIEGNVIEVLNTGNVEVMCSCCPCCCGVMKALTLFGGPGAQHISNYELFYDPTVCSRCGECVRRCFMNAMKTKEDGTVDLNADNCIGCGLCVTTCPSGALTLRRKPKENTYTPPTSGAMDLYDYVRELRRKSGEI
jgi:ferredoxin